VATGSSAHHVFVQAFQTYQLPADATAADSGTEGALTVVYNAGPSKILSFDMNIYYTGETPTVAGPGVVTQGIPFEVISGTSDAAAITVTLTNDES